MTKVSARPSAKLDVKGFVLGVSMGTHNHSGSVLRGIVDCINGSGFEYGIIDVSDTLHRYSLQLDSVSSENAHRNARAMGDAWLQQNAEILRGLKVPAKTIRWDQWLQDPRMPSTEKEVAAAVNQNNQLRMAIYADISNFYARKGLQPSAEKAALSMKYFVEELAVHTLLHSDYKVASIYPGRELESYKLIRSGAVQGFPEGIAGSFYQRLVPHKVKPAPETLHQLRL